MMRLLSIILIGLSFSAAVAHSGLMTHFDRPFYMIGERVHFTHWAAFGKDWPAHKQKVQVFDVTGELKMTFFVSNQGQPNTWGYFDIPFDWKTGLYIVRISILDELTDNQEVIVSHTLYVLDDLDQQSSLKTASSKVESTELMKDMPVSLNIQVADINVVNTSDVVNVKLKVQDGQGNPVRSWVSLCVRDQQLAGRDIIPGATFSLSESSNKELLPARFVHYSFKSNEGVDPLVLFERQSFRAYEVAPEDNEYLLKAIPGAWKLSFQAVTKEPLHSMVLVDERLSFIPKEIQLTPSQRTRIDLAINHGAQRRKINQWFDVDQEIPIHKVKPIDQAIPDFSRRPGEYKNLRSVEEFLREVSTPLKVRKSRKNGTVLKMVNPVNKPFFEGSPAFILNGIVQPNILELLQLDLSNISQIDFYNLPGSLSRFELLGENGVVVVTTNDSFGDSSRLDIFDVQGLQYSIDYPIQIAENNDSIPQFNPLIYWHPNLITNGRGEVEVWFNHSDDLGKFEIEVLATDELGNQGVGYSFYEVVNE